MKWERNNKVIEESIVDYLEGIFDDLISKNRTFKVSIGTDSQKISKTFYKFATVILIATSEDLGGGVVVGRGGMIISATYNHDFKTVMDENPRFRDVKLVNERMVFEVGKSIDAAGEIALLLDLYDVKMEIHADINPDPRWESNKALQSAIGYILGMGYDFKVKPEAWAASSGADKLC